MATGVTAGLAPFEVLRRREPPAERLHTSTSGNVTVH